VRERVTKAKTSSDASGGKSVSEKSQPTGGKVNEKSHVTRTSKNPFETSTGQKTQLYVGVVKDKMTGKNDLEFLFGWRIQIRQPYHSK
jgi:hypothetical protein